jgi:AraC-like DNA-binding protein
VSKSGFANPDNSIPLQALGDLLERCVAVTRCQHFGLRLGAGAGGNPLGLLGDVMERCVDVGTAIAHFHQYFHLLDRSALLTRTVAGASASIGYALTESTGPGADQISDAAAAIGMGLLRRLCGAQWKPQAVLLPRQRPRDVRPYEEVFACTPQFAAERAVLIFLAGDLLRRIAAADRERRAVLCERLTAVASQCDPDFADQVRRVVRGLLAVRRCSLDEVAALFGMSCRRINRKLERQGTTFHRISQEELCAQGRANAARHRPDAGRDFRRARLCRGRRVHPRLSQLAWRDAERVAPGERTNSGFPGRLTATGGGVAMRHKPRRDFAGQNANHPHVTIGKVVAMGSADHHSRRISAAIILGAGLGRSRAGRTERRRTGEDRPESGRRADQRAVPEQHQLQPRAREGHAERPQRLMPVISARIDAVTMLVDADAVELATAASCRRDFDEGAGAGRCPSPLALIERSS